MAQDFMSTQTGGVGETIQAKSNVDVSPEQFSAKLPVQAESAPQPQEQQVQQPQAQQEAPVESAQEVQVQQAEAPQQVAEQPTEQVTEKVTTQVSDPLDVANDSENVTLSDMTTDGDVIIDPAAEQKAEVKDVEVDPDTEIEYDEPTSDTTTDGEVILGTNQETDENLTEGYSPAVSVKLKGSRVLIDKTKGDPDPKKNPPKKDGYYKIPGSDAVFKKEGGTWYKSTNGGDSYFRLTNGDVEKRVAYIESSAVKFNDKNLKSTSQVVNPRQGNLGKFNLSNQAVTMGGNPVVSKNIAFTDLTKPKIGSETDKYNKDGTVNFNYNPNVARMSPETKAVYDASKKKLDNGLYKFPGREEALFKKENGQWYVDDSGSGKKFTKVTGENLDARLKNLEARAIPTTAGAVVLSRSIEKPITPNTNVSDALSFVDDIKAMTPKIEETNNQLKDAFEEGKNFTETEILNYAQDKLTMDQKEYLVGIQNDIKQILGDGSYSELKAQKIADLLSSGEQYFNDAVNANDIINKAYSAGISVDRLNYENKKKSFQTDFDQKSMSPADQFAARTFNEVRFMSDFILENVDEGNISIDPKTGEFSYTKNASPLEIEYIEKKLAENLQRYNQIMSERFAESKEMISNDKSSASDIKNEIESLQYQLGAARRKNDTNLSSALSAEIKSKKQELGTIEKRIYDNENLTNTLFLTNPKKILNNVAGLETETARLAFDALPKGLNSKQKFDLYYQNLQKKNQELATRNKIDYASMDRIIMRTKDLLDWEDLYSLSKAEQEYLKNKATLNALKPLYYNNDTGFTAQGTGFWDSLVNGYAKALTPTMSAADGYQSENEKAQIISQTMKDQGFNPDSFVTPDALDKIQEKTNVDFWSPQSFAEMTGTSLAYMSMVMLASEAPGTMLKGLVNAEKLITGANTITKAEKYAKGLNDAYNAAMSTTKLGRFLKPIAQEAVNFEIAGDIFNDPDNQLNLISGATGGVFGEAFSVAANKMGATKVFNYVYNIFGSNANVALNTLAKAGKMASRGLGEVPSELGEELAGIYVNSDNFQEMMAAAQESFGTIDKIQQFVISSIILGTAFGVAQGNTAKEAMDAMPEEKRNQVNAVLNQLRQDINKGKSSASDYAQSMLNKEEAQNKINKDDQEDQQRVSSEVGEGEKPVEEQPVSKPSEETPSPSGMVQGEQEQVTEEVTPTETKVTEEVIEKPQMTDQEISSKISEAVESNQGLADKLKSTLGSKIGDGTKLKGPKTQKISKGMKNAGFDVEEVVSMYNQAKQDGSNPQLVAEVEKIIMPNTETTADVEKAMEMQSLNMFDEISTISSIRNLSKKNDAIKEFEQRTGQSFKRVSKIERNFGNITRALKKSNLINIDC
jgi:hypothetical protein